MPELPEVEIMCRNLQRWAAGRWVRALEVRDPRVLRGAPEAWTHLEGARIDDVQRRAKWMLIGTDRGVVCVHFRMTGKVVRTEVTRASTRVSLVLDNGERVSFVDPRCLGEWHWHPDATLATVAAGLDLGPEPFPTPRSGAWWAERFRGVRGPIKPALLDGRRVAGLGNILASELCYRAHVHPATPVPALSTEAWDAIAASVVPLIDEVLHAESGDEIAFLHGEGRDAPNPFQVYGRAGEACRVCAHVIERCKQAGRATFLCPGCQAR